MARRENSNDMSIVVAKLGTQKHKERGLSSSQKVSLLFPVSRSFVFFITAYPATVHVDGHPYGVQVVVVAVLSVVK